MKKKREENFPNCHHRHQLNWILIGKKTKWSEIFSFSLLKKYRFIYVKTYGLLHNRNVFFLFPFLFFLWVKDSAFSALPECLMFAFLFFFSFGCIGNTKKKKTTKKTKKIYHRKQKNEEEKSKMSLIWRFFFFFFLRLSCFPSKHSSIFFFSVRLPS